MTNYCGYIALVGRPNVGKSTLLNCILKQKLSITSSKPQTTRHSIIGIDTIEKHQFIFVDTPGIHQGEKKAINRMMNKAASSTLNEVDVIAFVVEANRWQKDDEYILQAIKETKNPCILVINKVDKIQDKGLLLPWIEQIAALNNFAAIVPVSAKKNVQVSLLQDQLKSFLPEGEHHYDADELTNRSVKFLCAELLREKIFRLCGQEIPYSASVEIESFEEEDALIRMHALIIVDRFNHKRIIIGDNGLKLKEMATSARLDMEKLLDKKVFLKCWCKVKRGWSDNEHLLKQLGYDL